MDLKYKAHVHNKNNKTVILWLEEVEEDQLENLLSHVGKNKTEKQVDSSSKIMMSELGL